MSEPSHDPADCASESRSGARKERVLHTRISEQLAADIRRVAEDLRVPASNLVRNVLEEAFSAIETMSDRVGGWLDEAIGEVERARARARGAAPAQPGAPAEPAPAPESSASSASPDDVLAWQRVTLNRAVPCAGCGRTLVRGDRVQLALTSAGAGATVLCLACFEARA